MQMSDPDIDREGLVAAALALCERLGAEADEQCAYFHRFADGRVSMELEWVDPTCLAGVAVLAYLEAVRRSSDQQ